MKNRGKKRENPTVTVGQSEVKASATDASRNAYGVKRYNPRTRPRHLNNEMKRYAEHHGNVVKTRIKSLVDNKLTAGTILGVSLLLVIIAGVGFAGYSAYQKVR